MITEYTVSTSPSPDMSANVKDKYKNWLNEEIKADLDLRRSDMVNIFMHLTSDFNVSSGIRSHNSFLGKEVYIVGRRKYDKRGTVGTYKYEHVYNADNLAEVIDVLHDRGYKVYAVDNIFEYDPKNYWDVSYPCKSAFVYGEESRGLSDEEIKMCDDMIYIASPGSVRSLNVAAAASCVMAEYSRQYWTGRR